jgi:uncharacterized protein YjiS (DUF1127 family)
MSLMSLIAAACKTFQDALRERAQAELLAPDDHTLVDLGLRGADFRAGLWQPSGTVDGEPSTSSMPPHPRVFCDGWFQLF